MEPTDLLLFDLGESERRLLRAGLVDWGSPARCTEELAIAMGFAAVQEFHDFRRRLIPLVASGDALTAIDRVRVLIATEIVFASDVFGSGVEWSTTTGLSDEDAVSTLRSVQRSSSE